jgi:hypothetical protein
MKPSALLENPRPSNCAKDLFDLLKVVSLQIVCLVILVGIQFV